MYYDDVDLAWRLRLADRGGSLLPSRSSDSRLRVLEGQLQVAVSGAQPLVVLARPPRVRSLLALAPSAARRRSCASLGPRRHRGVGRCEAWRLAAAVV